MTFKKRKLFCILLCAVLLVLSASCSGGGGTNDGSTPSGTKKPAKTEKDIKITQTAAKSAETEKYETADFTMTIPKGRKVTSGGTNIYHSIRVYDPEEPINQMFILLKHKRVELSRPKSFIFRILGRFSPCNTSSIGASKKHPIMRKLKLLGCFAVLKCHIFVGTRKKTKQCYLLQGFLTQ